MCLTFPGSTSVPLSSPGDPNDHGNPASMATSESTVSRKRDQILFTFLIIWSQLIIPGHLRFLQTEYDAAKQLSPEVGVGQEMDHQHL